LLLLAPVDYWLVLTQCTDKQCLIVALAMTLTAILGAILPTLTSTFFSGGLVRSNWRLSHYSFRCFRASFRPSHASTLRVTSSFRCFHCNFWYENTLIFMLVGVRRVMNVYSSSIVLQYLVLLTAFMLISQ